MQSDRTNNRGCKRYAEKRSPWALECLGFLAPGRVQCSNHQYINLADTRHRVGNVNARAFCSWFTTGCGGFES